MSGLNRKAPQINNTSTADIAFMMLLFFLLTTSMDTDQGLARTLPPPPESVNKDDSKADVNRRNILVVKINSTNDILCNDEVVDLIQLKEKAKEFIENPRNSESLPVKKEVDIPYFGRKMITEGHIISLQCDRGTNYQAYIDVQNELATAYNELRDVVSRDQFGKRFKDLNEDEQKAVRIYYNQMISEAEPKTYGDKK